MDPIDDLMFDDELYPTQSSYKPSIKSGNQPDTSFRIGTISAAAVWRNTSKEGYTFFNIKVNKRYVDNDGKWQSNNSFSPSEALVAAECLRQAAVWASQEKGQGFRN